MIVDRRWDLVSANAPALAILSDGVAPELLAPPTNALRVCLHPDGLAPRIANPRRVPRAPDHAPAAPSFFPAGAATEAALRDAFG